MRTSNALTSGTFSNSLMRFGYQDSGTGASGPGPATAQFGDEITSPVTFQFIAPSCTLSAGTANQVITLPKIGNSALPSVGATAGATGFMLNLENCVTQSVVTLTVGGTTETVSSVLQNNGSAQGVGLQLLNGGANGTPLPLNANVAMGNVGTATAMGIPLGVRYYRLDTVGPGTVSSVATVNFDYN
ncbi:fimbrial protein [Cupriavidus sp. BIC8F]|uniref:fimbrial protein n=1 Tax=Cupriavidus sp. BIC8F TaxID=3079014 RepID=UPI002916C3D9|nr:fimbrial protein [Cupriavidus sp. BIC8F]